jgi:hypothetical protein
VEEFGEERMRCALVSDWKSTNSLITKTARQVLSKVKTMLIIFFETKRIVYKEFVLPGQTVNSAHGCDVLLRPREKVQKICPQIRRQKNWLLHHDNARSHSSFFTREFLTKTLWLSSPTHPIRLTWPPDIFFVPLIEDVAF